MLEQTKEVIDGTTYLITQMDGVRALKAQAKLIKILGSGITDLTSADIKSLLQPKDGAVNIEGILSALKPLLNNFDDTEVVNFILSLFEEGVLIEKKTSEGKAIPQPLVFENHFRGRINTVWKLTVAIIKANFSLGELLQ